MRIALIEPPPQGIYGNLRSKGSFGNFKADISWPPIDLIILAGFIRHQGHSCFIIDAGGERLDLPEIEKRLAKEKYDVCLFNTSTTTIFLDMEIAFISKKVNPTALTGALGVHPMAEPEETLSMESTLDFCIYTEIEPPLLQIMNGMALESINGVAWKKAGVIIKNPPASPLKNLDDMGTPAHDLIPLGIYKDPQVQRTPYSVTMATRGCVCACTFCSAPLYNFYRKRSLPNVIKELKWITEELGVKEIKFYDDGLAYDRKWLVALCNAIVENKIDITWNTNERAEFIDLELAQLMKRAGCYSINIGVESGNPNILKNADKRTTHEKILIGANAIKAAGIKLMTYFIVGLPGETRETAEETYQLAIKLDGDFATFNVATPHPGTPFMTYLENNGYLLHRDYILYDQNNLPCFEYPDFSAEDMLKTATLLTRRFYLRPRMIFKKVMEIRSYFQLINFAKNVLAFCRHFVLDSERIRPIADAEVNKRIEDRKTVASKHLRVTEMGQSKELHTWREYKSNKKLTTETPGQRIYTAEAPAFRAEE